MELVTIEVKVKREEGVRRIVPFLKNLGNGLGVEREKVFEEEKKKAYWLMLSLYSARYTTLNQSITAAN